MDARVPSSHSCVAAFLNDIDPELKCDVLSSGSSQIRPHLVAVPASQDRQVKRKQADVVACAWKYFDQTLLVVLRVRCDRHNIQVHAMLLVKIRLLAGEC